MYTTVGCRYNRVQYHMIFHTSLQLLRQNINQECKSTKDIPYLVLTGELWGVFCENFQENWPFYNGTALCVVNWYTPLPIIIKYFTLGTSQCGWEHNYFSMDCSTQLLSSDLKYDIHQVGTGHHTKINLILNRDYSTYLMRDLCPWASYQTSISCPCGLRGVWLVVGRIMWHGIGVSSQEYDGEMVVMLLI